MPEVINEPGSFWVYVGQLQNNQFLHPPNFSRPRLAPPNAGDVLTAVIDTYKRSDPPVQIDGDWKLGQIIGVIPKTKQIRVEKVQTVEGGNIWVRAANAAQ